MTDHEDAIPDFDLFGSAPIFRNLETINDFVLRVEIPKLNQWFDSGIANRVLVRTYDEVLRILEAAEFYAFDRLQPVKSNTRIGANFEDDEFGFEVSFDSQGDIVVRRRGSSMRRFHEWYRRIMPSMESLVGRLVQAIAEETLGPESQAGKDLEPVRVSYYFGFVGYDFCRPPSDETERNMSILMRALRAAPSGDGHLQNLQEGSSAFDEYGRVDVNINRWSESPAGMAREVYSVECPSNRRFSSVWFNFSFIGETFQSPDGKRSVFRASDFLRFFEAAYVGFLKEKAIEHFLADLTRGFVFRTTAGSLP